MENRIYKLFADIGSEILIASVLIASLFTQGLLFSLFISAFLIFFESQTGTFNPNPKKRSD